MAQASSTRRNFSAAVKRAAWQRCNGRCQDCTAPVAAGGFIFDHIVPWELTRDSSIANCQVLCLTCDDDKTYGRDIPMIAEADRKAESPSPRTKSRLRARGASDAAAPERSAISPAAHEPGLCITLIILRRLWREAAESRSKSSSRQVVSRIISAPQPP